MTKKTIQEQCADRKAHKQRMKEYKPPGRAPVDDTIEDFVEKQAEVLNVLQFCTDLQVTHPSFYQGRIKSADKFIAVAAYIVHGSARKASKYMGGRVKAATIYKWRHEARWWPEVEQAVKKAQGFHLDHLATTVIHEAGEAQLDRIRNGDEKLDKNGEIVRVGVSGRDLAQIQTQAFNMRALQRGDPTSRSEKVTQDDRLKQLEEKFRSFGGDAKVIDAEVIEDK